MEKNDHINKTTDDLDPSVIHEMKQPPVEKLSAPIEINKLRDEAKDRAKKRPILQKIAQVLKGKVEPFREIIINCEPLERRVALLVDGVLDRFEVERANEDRMVGAIFKGKIQNLEPGLKAAFVDIGQAKNAFLHYWDILPAVADSNVEIVRENQTEDQKRNREKISLKDIPKLYPIGTEIVVQITKTQIGTKGPRTTTNISIPGRFIVLTPYSGQCGISRKIEDPRERDRLKKIIRSLTLPEGMGMIIRTAGEGKKIRYFIRDLHLLINKWQRIVEKMNSSSEPMLLDQEPNILERTVRDFLTEDIDRILVDRKEDQQEVLEAIDLISPRSHSKVALFQDNIPIFERFNIERQIEQTFMRKVPLPSGGEIVIEETEALTAIDVNTGSHKEATKDSKDFIVNVNLEAAKESARQIRLRNIGGLIILDFIDMKNKRDRKDVLDLMRDELSKDKAKSHILPISPLGIMQMTRQRHEESIGSGFYMDCPYCHGRSIVKSERSMSVEIQRRLVSVIRHARRGGSIEKALHYRILLHPLVLERLRTEDEHLLVEIEKQYNVRLSFRADPVFHIENFKIIEQQSGQEVR